MVAEVFDTGGYEPVYNLRVADYHTYFIGADGWGFAVWAHNTCAQAFEALANSPEMQARGVTLAMLRRSPHFVWPAGSGRLFTNAQRVRRASLEDFQSALELALDRSGWLATDQHLSLQTALTVRAAEVSRPAGVPVDPSLENPYAEGSREYRLFQAGVIVNPQFRSYYRRIQELDRRAGPEKRVARLISLLPGGANVGQIQGLPYQLARTEYYQDQGQLVEVEKQRGSKRVDLELTGGLLVDTKAWTRTWWFTKLDEDGRRGVIAQLEEQVREYLGATSTVTYRLRLEFKYFIPDEVRALIAELTTGPSAPFPGRIEPPVVIA